MKRYGHKNTGLVYIEDTDNLYYWRNNGKFDQSIPKEIIENSNDWKLLNSKFLFKTIDGVNIYEGDEFWCINVHANLTCKVYSSQEVKDDLPINYEWVHKFSTKELAENSLINKVVCLSLEDVRKIIPISVQRNIKYFENLIREKIKLPK